MVAAAFPLDTTPVALGLELFLPLLTGVAPIRIHFRTGIPVIQYGFKVSAVMDRGRVGHQLAVQFVFAIYAIICCRRSGLNGGWAAKAVTRLFFHSVTAIIPE